ncbi:hypothetical protein LEP1GSC021_3884 [Leptospira noguchii str. 1993005606]|nr:hypothetical protein LEP1GSC021_3884 [Leptospira noguchii str. 1993005606]
MNELSVSLPMGRSTGRVNSAKRFLRKRFRLKNTHFSSVPTRMSLFTCKKYVFLIEKNLPNFST